MADRDEGSGSESDSDSDSNSESDSNSDTDPTPVVTVFLRSDCEVLLLCRSEEVGSYTGRWGGVAGHVEREDDPDDTAHREIREETGLDEHVTLVRRGDPFEVDDDDGGGDWGRRWLVHPYLFDCDSREVHANYETVEFEWVAPTEILRRETVPRLWTSYDRVRPTPWTVAGDTEHGSAYLSLRALECLRDEAALEAERGADEWEPVAAVARDLLEARPPMAVVTNRVNRAMSRAGGESARAVETATGETIADALDADDRAARWETLDPPASVLTLSRSGTVRRTIETADPDRVFVAESRPAREGVGVAESLADSLACEVCLHTDAAVGHVLATEDVEAVLVGADAVLADGSVVNKTGTRLAALAARNEGVPCYAVCAADKVTPRTGPTLESGPADEVYEGADETGSADADADLSVLNPTFDVTPAALVTGVLTDRGLLDADDVAAVATEHEELAGWDADADVDVDASVDGDTDTG